jgi:O-antigen/teichoic acid export membrane protein
MTGQTASLPGLWATFRTKVIARKFLRDVGVLTIANGVAVILSFMQGILVARWLGPELYGVAALVMSYPSLVYTFFDARSSEASVKYLSEFHARGEHDRVLAMCRLGYVIDAGIAAVAFVIVLLTAPWAARNIAHDSEMVSLIVVYAAALVPNALVGTASATLATLGHFSLIAKITTVTTFLRTAGVLGFVGIGWQISGVVWGNVIATAVSGLLYGTCTWLLSRRVWGASPFQGSWQALRGRRREILGFLAYNDLGTLLGMIPKQLDIALLGYFRNSAEVGYYKLAKNLSGVVSYLVRPLQSVIYPQLALLRAEGNTQDFQDKVRRLALQVGFPLGVIVIVSTLFIPFLLPLLVGSTYRPAVLATQFLLAGAGVWLAFFWLRPLFLARGWIKEWTGCVALFAFCNLVGWLVIVPGHGFIGMSIWWLLSTVGIYTIPPLLFLMR